MLDIGVGLVTVGGSFLRIPLADQFSLTVRQIVAGILRTL